MKTVTDFAREHLPAGVKQATWTVWSLLRRAVSKLVHPILYYFPHKFVHSLLYYRAHGERLDWDNPKTYDEKIHWLIVNVYDKTYGKYADKLAVREYVKECGLEELLVPMYGAYRNAEEIDFDALPERFVLMCTHGCGGVITSFARTRAAWT